MKIFFRIVLLTFVISSFCIALPGCTKPAAKESLPSSVENSVVDKEISTNINEQITEVITKYVNDYANNQDLAVSHFFNTELIESNKLIEIKDCDQRFASVTNYSGKYTSAKAFLVTYDIRYKLEAENLVTEESGIKTKYFVLIETEKGWLIDSIGY